MEQTTTETMDPVKQLATESDLSVPTLHFTKDLTPATFVAEYTFDGNDIVYHFYPPQGGMVTDYWKNLFAKSLERVAVSHFDAGPSRLRAAYTDELASWWLRASGFAVVGDPDLMSKKLFEKLDEDFSREIVNARQGR